MKKILNFIQVSDKIATSGQPTKKQFKKIAKKGYEVVVNLATDKSSNALKDEDRIVSKNGMIYFHIPLSWQYPQKERLHTFLKLLELLDKEDKKVFIHCAKNYRVSMFIYKYKKDVLQQKGVKLIAPKGFKPNVVWKKFIKV